MSKTVLFVGSSSLARAQTKALVAKLQAPDLEFLPWWDAFPAGRTLLDQLDTIRSRVSGAVLVLSPDLPVTVRGRSLMAPNLNVLFEFGYFYGHFDKSRVAIVKYGDVYTPSDLGGYVHIYGSTSFRGTGANKISSRTASEFRKWLGAFPKQPEEGKSFWETTPRLPATTNGFPGA
jgi:predicted nucleotide-binding protein